MPAGFIYSVSISGGQYYCRSAALLPYSCSAPLRPRATHPTPTIGLGREELRQQGSKAKALLEAMRLHPEEAE
jgi:hypothetical protein